MNNIINFDSAQPASAIPGTSGPTASPNDKNAFFAAILDQQMGGPTVCETDEANSGGDVTQGLASSIALMKMLPAWVGQINDPKVPLSTNNQIKNTPDDNAENNPALAMWIAAMVSAQMQPTVQDPKQMSNIAEQLSGSGVKGPTNALQAMEQQFPSLAILTKKMDLKNKPAFDDAQAEKSATNNDTAPVSNPVQAQPDEKPIAEAALLVKQTAPQEKADKAHVPVNAPVNPLANPLINRDLASPKISSVAEKGKHENLGLNPAVKNAPQQPVQSLPQDQNVNTKSQGQNTDQKNQDSSQGQGHSNSDTKKDFSTAQFQSSSDQEKSPADASASSIPQNNFAAVAQPSSHSNNSTQTHAEGMVSSQPLSVREAGNVSAAEQTPRIVHTARLMEAAGQAEMRVSVKSESIGSVDVRATLQGDHISATVAAQHGGTRDWLMTNMHELQSSLSKDDLNLRTFEVTDSSLQNNGHGAQSNPQEQQQHKGTYTQFEKETHSTTVSFDDMDVQENSAQALSLLA